MALLRVRREPRAAERRVPPQERLLAGFILLWREPQPNGGYSISLSAYGCAIALIGLTELPPISHK